MKAFPGKQTVWNEETGYHVDVNHGGMELRDYFAAKAMQSLILGLDNGNEAQADLIPTTAYGFADLMMKARQ